MKKKIYVLVLILILIIGYSYISSRVRIKNNETKLIKEQMEKEEELPTVKITNEEIEKLYNYVKVADGELTSDIGDWYRANKSSYKDNAYYVLIRYVKEDDYKSFDPKDYKSLENMELMNDQKKYIPAEIFVKGMKEIFNIDVFELNIARNYSTVGNFIYNEELNGFIPLASGGNYPYNKTQIIGYEETKEYLMDKIIITEVRAQSDVLNENIYRTSEITDSLVYKNMKIEDFKFTKGNVDKFPQIKYIFFKNSDGKFYLHHVENVNYKEDVEFISKKENEKLEHLSTKIEEFIGNYLQSTYKEIDNSLKVKIEPSFSIYEADEFQKHNYKNSDYTIYTVSADIYFDNYDKNNCEYYQKNTYGLSCEENNLSLFQQIGVKEENNDYNISWLSDIYYDNSNELRQIFHGVNNDLMCGNLKCEAKCTKYEDEWCIKEVIDINGKEYEIDYSIAASHEFYYTDKNILHLECGDESTICDMEIMNYDNKVLKKKETTFYSCDNDRFNQTEYELNVRNGILKYIEVSDNGKLTMKTIDLLSNNLDEKILYEMENERTCGTN